VTLARAVAVAWPWRSHASARLKAAGLIPAALFGTPDSLDDDPWRWLPPSLFGPATGFLADSNAGRKTTLAAVWIVLPIAHSFAVATLIPFTVPLLLAACALLPQRKPALRYFGFSRAVQ
jgi:hypothetical protein